MRMRRTEQRGQQTPSQDSNQDPTRFDHRLIAGLTEDEVGEFAGRWKNASLVRQAAAQVLTKELERVILLSESPENVNSPNPLAVLADLHGYRRGLRTAIKLLTNQDP